MKIGNHISQRATYKNKDGYFFETMIEADSFIFVFDEHIGHDAKYYFNNHKDEWNEELKDRCWYVGKYEVTFKHEVKSNKKVII